MNWVFILRVSSLMLSVTKDEVDRIALASLRQLDEVFQ